MLSAVVKVSKPDLMGLGQGERQHGLGISVWAGREGGGSKGWSQIQALQVTTGYYRLLEVTTYHFPSYF